ncbi:hypothetical protein OJF2_74920 [Aquisphaera giovannonii]|uniref:DUF2961 domain-containing protein n=1 Tax=Aquisphaera giovannonii TaxID=406548 RepID=A0A5B9WE76_9BACT|nr:DUF2961 domain-containing protein [Aquisphaera giovannonii]QEH38882.1 hypothetical protein OJF2_74920 [Aquisphaera giovannonii]
MRRDDARPRGHAVALGLATLAMLLAGGLPARADDEPITVESLLRGMADTRWLASPLEAGERTVQFSSYDRATRLVDGRIINPFANADVGNYLRVEGEGARQEFVLAESQGPGYVSRIWSANPDGELRIYIDGAATPALAASFARITNGEVAPFSAPFGHDASRGRNLYFPFPFAKSIKITTTTGKQYFQVAVTTFAPGTKVESYSPEVLRQAAPVIDEVRQALLNPDRDLEEGSWRADQSATLAPGREAELPTRRGPAAIHTMAVQVAGEDLEEALAKTLLTITFDDAESPQVAVPLGDFFGTGPGANAFRSAVHTVMKDGTMKSRWYMPYRKSAKVSVKNLGAKPTTIKSVVQGDFSRPPADSMYFHARWLQRDGVQTKKGDGTLDWPSLRVSGAPGRFVGLQLNIYNPVSAWWGEGDEKVYVDGESFPSTFGTGTEDYFGYAWGSPVPYTNAFHAQTRCDGPGSKGNNSEVRYQILDAVPFRSSLAFDIELWHWEAVKVQFATLAYFYAGPGAKVEPGVPDLSGRKVYPKPPIHREPGVVEGERLKVLSKSSGDVTEQAMGGFGEAWSGDSQLIWPVRQQDATIELELPVAKAGTYDLAAAFTKAGDYGTFGLSLDGKPLQTVDLYEPAPRVVHTGPIALGTVQLDAGNHALGVRVTGKNPRSTGFLFGLDWVKLTPTTR